MWTLNPDRVVIMGDLLSSQHISDDEFHWRTDRFHRIFHQGTQEKKVFYMSGNHDIGYGWDMTRYRVERFEERYQKVNELIHDPEIQLNMVFFNSMLLDPASDQTLRNETWEFLQNLHLPQNQTTILFSHVPLYKSSGLCQDAPEIHHNIQNGAVQWQHMLSENASHFLLQHFHQPALILTGHDHHGCITLHQCQPINSPPSSDLLSSSSIHSTCQFQNNPHRISTWPLFWDFPRHNTLEITVRSIMAEFHGTIGLLELQFQDGGSSLKRVAYTECRYVNHVVMWFTLITSGVILGVLVGLRIFYTRLFGTPDAPSRLRQSPRKKHKR